MTQLKTLINRTLAILTVIVAVTGACVLYAVERNLHDASVIRQLQEQDKQIESILKHVVNLETGLRGFVITGNDAFLEPYHAARTALPAEFTILERLIDEQPASSRNARRDDHVTNIRVLIERWYADAASPQILARRRQGAEAAAELVKSQRGKRLTDAIRNEAATMHASLQHDLRSAQTDATRTLRFVQVLVPALLLMMVVASLLLGSYLTRRLTRAFRDLSDATRRIASGHYDERAPQAKLHEAHELATHFNTMARAVQDTRNELQARHDALERQHAHITRANTEAARLAELTDTLQACYTLQEGYAVLQRTLAHVFPDWNGTVSVMAASRNLLEVTVQWGDHAWRARAATSTPEACWALRKGQPYTREHPMSMPCLQQTPGHEHPYLCIPLVAQGDAVGTLRLSSRQAALPTEDITHVREYAQTVARQVALAIANLQLRDKLRQQSIRDALTGAFNRRYLEETLTRELAGSARGTRPLSVLAVDIDHFKRFNDTFGHEGGDAMLVAVARLMQEHFRTEDVVCRYGGEEFVIVLPDAEHADALERADGFRQAVRGLQVTSNGHALGQVSVSIGVATFPAHGTAGVTLIAAADTALYEAKRHGRDRVVGAAVGALSI